MWQRIRGGVKHALDGCSLVVVAPCAGMCALEAWLTDRGEGVFTLWAQVFALAPGLPGLFLRRAFYRLTLDECSRNCFIGFGALFSHRQAIVEDDVYIGTYAIVGSSKLRRGCLLGSRVSVISGAELHTLDDEGRWTASDLSRLRQIEIGEHAWVGEASAILADVGRSAMVAAGSVVSSRVPPRIVVAGNPARFVRSLTSGANEEARRADAAMFVR